MQEVGDLKGTASGNLMMVGRGNRMSSVGEGGIVIKPLFKIKKGVASILSIFDYDLDWGRTKATGRNSLIMG